MGLILLLAVGLVFGFIVLVACSISAIVKVNRLGDAVRRQERDLCRLEETVLRIERSRKGAEPRLPELQPEDAPAPRIDEAGPAKHTPAEEGARPASQERARPISVHEHAGPPAPAAGREWWTRFEDDIGKRWMTWAGALALFLAAGFFVKYAIDNRWLGPTARVVLGVLFGLALLSLGDRSVRRSMRALGQGLMGGGLAILYVCLFAAFSLYELVPQPVAFAAMVVVTAAGMTLAVLHDAVAMSFLAVLGGLLTPILVSTGEDARDVLLLYVILLDLGVLGVAFFRRWRALDVLAFVGTWALFSGWFWEFYDKAALVPAFLWLTLFYLTFLVLPFIHHLRRGTPVALERFIMALANAVVGFTYAYQMLASDHRHTLGFVALGMAACYVAMGSLTRKRLATDARALFGFVGLAVVFLTMAVPLHLKWHGITLGWAVEGPVLLYLGYRYRYLPVRAAGFLVLLVAVIRLFAVHWPLHEDGVFFVLILNRHFGTALCVPVAAALCSLIHHWWRTESHRVDRGLKVGSGIVAGFLGLIIVHAEQSLWLTNGGHAYLARCFSTVLWALGSIGFLAAGLRAKSLASRVSGCVALFVAFILAAALYEHGLGSPYLLFLNLRFAAALVMVLAAFTYAFGLRRHREVCRDGEQTFGIVLYVAAALLLLILLSREAYVYCLAEMTGPKAQWTARMAISVVWGVYAAIALAVGFWRQVRAVRVAALALFGLTAGKLVLVDIAGVKQIYRIISFFVLGLLMMGAAYAYHRIEQSLAAPSGEPERE